MGSIYYFLESTMLIERLFGVGIYALVLGYFFNKIQHASSAQSICRILNQYLVILCIMAFFYIPGANADLFRWRNLAEPWKDASFSWFWDNRVTKSSTPVGYLLIYVCQMTGINGLLPMICALGFFGNVFHILKCEAMRENKSSDSAAVELLFFMSSGVFLEVISGVRCMLSFAIVLRCVYDEIYCSKSFIRHIPFYIIACLLHNAALPLIGIRLFCMLFEGEKNAVLMIINFFTVAIVLIVSIRFGNDYIDAAFAKADSYTSRNVYSYSWEYIIAALGVIVLLRILWLYRKRYSEQWRIEKNGLRYLIFILIVDVLSVGTYSIFHRYFTAVMIVSIPVVYSFLNGEYENEFNKNRTMIVCASLLILLLACARGNLCGYKFFLLN